MAKTRVEKHEAVEIGVVGIKEIGFMQGVEVIDVGGDLHLVRNSVLDDSSEGIRRRPLGQGKFGISIGHGFRSNKDKMYG